MITVLTPNSEQFNSLNGYRNGLHRIEFVLDGRGRYIVGLEVLTHYAFAEIREQLNQLERIEYTPNEEI
jgi:hypothetical protein